MSAVHFFVGQPAGADLATALQAAAATPAWTPFDPRAVAFVGRLSRRLLTDRQVREFPELAALAHWFRPARLRDLAEALPRAADRVARGRGLAFHIAPANVDSVAMYSWLISLLAGNVNWVRVSQKTSAQLNYFLGALRDVLAEDAGQPIAGRIVLFTYPHDEAVTRTISMAAMLRVVWGGDATVSALRAIPLRPTAFELCFPDRFSLAAFDAQALLALPEEGWPRLAEAFHNDAFWFAQQACSSPRVLAWIGPEAACQQARPRFWAAVQADLARRQPENTPAMTVARLAATCELAAAARAHPADAGTLAAFPTRLDLEAGIDPLAKELHCGNGLFLEQRLDRLADLAPQLTDKEQTLTVHGFSRETLLELVDALPPRAVDRIVPLGRALDFDTLWDGMDLFGAFTRQISLPPTTS